MKPKVSLSVKPLWTQEGSLTESTLPAHLTVNTKRDQITRVKSKVRKRTDSDISPCNLSLYVTCLYMCVYVYIGMGLKHILVCLYKVICELLV